MKFEEQLEDLKTEFSENEDAYREYLWNDDVEGELEYVTEEVSDSGRWQEYVTTILQHTESKRYIGFHWSRGLTESQEDDGPGDDVFEVIPVEKTVITWKTV